MRTLVALVLAVALTACGGADPVRTSEPELTGDREGDLAFATELMHRDAALLNLLDVALGRRLPARLVTVTEELRLETTDRIEDTSDLFVDWGEKAPVTVRDHSAGHSSDHDVPDLDGMPDGADLQELGALPKREFEPAFRDLLAGALASTLALAEGHESGDLAVVGLVDEAVGSCTSALGVVEAP